MLILNVETTFDEYIRVVEQFCKIIQKYENIIVIPYRFEEFEFLKDRFESWTPEKQNLKLSSFLAYKAHCEELWNENKSIMNERESFVRFLKSQKLYIHDQEAIEKLISFDTFTEIYDLNYVQIYRSLDFFNHTNHSLMALETFEWWELFQRSPEISAKVHAVAQQVFLGITSDPIYNPIEEHVVQELETNKPMSHLIQSLVYAPTLGVGGEFLGGLHVCRINKSRSLKFQVLPAADLTS